VAIVGSMGEVLGSFVIRPKFNHRPDSALSDKDLDALCSASYKFGVTYVAIGDGTASRETEKVVASLIRNGKLSEVKYAIVGEQGASVYR